jgi:hypothetical protein
MDTQDPQKLAQMLQQQQAMKFLQSLQGTGAMSDMDRMQSGIASGMQGAMGEAQRMQPSFDGMTQMPQEAAVSPESIMPIANPQGSYGMPMPQQSYSANMPTNPQMGRRDMLQGAINSLSQQGMGQGMGQGAMSNKDLDMMRRMPR